MVFGNCSCELNAVQCFSTLAKCYLRFWRYILCSISFETLWWICWSTTETQFDALVARRSHLFNFRTMRHCILLIVLAVLNGWWFTTLLTYNQITKRTHAAHRLWLLSKDDLLMRRNAIFIFQQATHTHTPFTNYNFKDIQSKRRAAQRNDAVMKKGYKWMNGNKQSILKLLDSH